MKDVEKMPCEVCGREVIVPGLTLGERILYLNSVGFRHYCIEHAPARVRARLARALEEMIERLKAEKRGKHDDE